MGMRNGTHDYTYFSMMHSSQVGYPGNDAFLQNKEVDRLIEAGRETGDPEKRMGNTMMNWKSCWDRFLRMQLCTMTALMWQEVRRSLASQRIEWIPSSAEC